VPRPPWQKLSRILISPRRPWNYAGTPPFPPRRPPKR
jgi:hypothetical protein